jgi:acetyltransferase-like isoleucine patch superfamily enzyme
VIHEFNVFVCSKDVIIGNNAAIAHGVSILTTSHNYINYSKKTKHRLSGNSHKEIIIKDDVWIGCNVVILQGVVIGEGAVIGAHSLVNKDIPKYSLWGGIPAKKIKEFDPIFCEINKGAKETRLRRLLKGFDYWMGN